MSHFGQYQDYGHWIMVSCIKVDRYQYYAGTYCPPYWGLVNVTVCACS